MNQQLRSRTGVVGAFVLALSLAAAMVLASALFSAASAGPMYSVTVQVTTSDGAPLSGVMVNDDCDGFLSTFGTTDTSGTVTGSVPGATCDFYANYKETTAQRSVTVNADGQIISFQTADVTARLIDHTGTQGLAGGIINFFPSDELTFGTTGADGTVSAQIFPGAYTFEILYHGRTESQPNVAVTNGSVVTFQTAQLTIQYSGGVTYAGPGYPIGFTKPSMELLPGSYDFSFGLFDYNQIPCSLTISTATAGHTSVQSVIKEVLRDSNGNPLSGGVAGAYVPYLASVGTTNADGVACRAFPKLLGSTAAQMSYKDTTSATITQDVATNSVFEFQSSAVTVQLLDHSGNGLAGGTAGFTNHYLASLGTTDAGGKVVAQMFPGTYTFQMTYNGTKNVQSGVAVTNGSAVTFQTAQLNLEYSGTVGYMTYGNYLKGFAKPSMELLPGSYDFSFIDYKQPTCTLSIDTGAAGSASTQSVIKAVLRDSHGNPIQDGVAGVYVPFLSAVGHTNANGVACRAYPRMLGNIGGEMTYRGTTSATITQDVATNSVYQFQTASVTVKLVDGDGNGLPGGVAGYTGSGTLYAFGGPGNNVTGADGTVSAELFPGTYPFQVTYNKTTLTQDATVGNGSVVTFTYNP
ncbi:MAG TPA: hypothetical protein VFI42_01275 [Thermomicrobiaceae bacterium]|nr:hypothetical protein [Thermomicrobiaceae bacterium]